MYLKTQGISPNGHAVKDDLDRVKEYMAKIRKMEESGDKRAVKVNAEAASRVVKQALGENESQVTDKQDGAGAKRRSNEDEERSTKRAKRSSKKAKKVKKRKR